jgi:hypothetical protein
MVLRESAQARAEPSTLQGTAPPAGQIASQ